VASPAQSFLISGIAALIPLVVALKLFQKGVVLTGRRSFHTWPFALLADCARTSKAL
jgi:hypothetical protein